MANRGPPTLQPSPLYLLWYPLFPPVQPLVPPAQPAVPPAQPGFPSVQPGPMPQLNWPHFKPEFAGKPDEDAEVHLPRTYDWMDTHSFPEGSKSKDFV